MSRLAAVWTRFRHRHPEIATALLTAIVAVVAVILVGPSPTNLLALVAVVASASTIFQSMLSMAGPQPLIDVIDRGERFDLVIDPRLDKPFWLVATHAEVDGVKVELGEDIACYILGRGPLKKPLLTEPLLIEHQTVLKVDKEKLRVVAEDKKGEKLPKSADLLFIIEDAANHTNAFNDRL